MVERIRDFVMSSLIWSIYITSLLPRFRDDCRKEEEGSVGTGRGNDCKEECLPKTAGKTHVGTHSSCDNTNKSCASSDHTNTSGGDKRRQEIPPLAEQLLTTERKEDNWEKGGQFWECSHWEGDHILVKGYKARIYGYNKLS